MGIEVHVFGKDEFVAKYKKAVSALPGLLQATMQQQMTQLADYVRANKLSGSPLNRRSNTLSNRVSGRASVSGKTIIGGVGVTGVPYAVIWEKTGIRAHDVFPVNRKALKFMVGGQTIFAKRVHIPAQDARPFLRPSMEENTDKVLAALKQTVMDTLNAT